MRLAPVCRGLHIHGNIFCHRCIRVIICKLGSPFRIHGHPYFSSIDGKIFCLDLASIGIDDNAVHPNGYLCRIPAIFPGRHSLARPSLKSIGAIGIEPCPNSDIFPACIYLRVDFEHFYIFGYLTRCFRFIADFNRIGICDRNPCIFSFQLLICRLDAALIRVNNHVSRGSRNPAVIPARIIFVSCHFFAWPCFKGICAIICPSPNTWLSPIFGHLCIHDDPLVISCKGQCGNH